MLAIHALTLVFAAMVSADSSAVTTSMYLWDFVGSDLSASIMSAGPSATTYSVACSSTSTCNFPGGVTIVDGAETAAMAYSYSGVTASGTCQISSNTGKCWGTGSTSGTTNSASSTYTDLAAETTTGVMDVTVTAGADSTTAAGTGTSSTQPALAPARETNIMLAGVAGVVGMAVAAL